jgi:hypothetical protein
VRVNLSSVAALGGGVRASQREDVRFAPAAKHGQSSKQAPPKDPKPRKISAKLWLANNFPLKVKQLVPLMEVMSHANKHFAKV